MTKSVLISLLIFTGVFGLCVGATAVRKMYSEKAVVLFYPSYSQMTQAEKELQRTRLFDGDAIVRISLIESKTVTYAIYTLYERSHNRHLVMPGDTIDVNKFLNGEYLVEIYENE